MSVSVRVRLWPINLFFALSAPLRWMYNKMLPYPCIICERSDYTPVFGGKNINGFTLNECSNCGMVLAFPLDETSQWQNFKDFGDYLLKGRNAAGKRIADLSKQTQSTFDYLKERFGNPSILEFGAGGGFLCKAAQRAGLNITGIEPSSKLRTYARDNLGFDNLRASIFDFTNRDKFHAVLTYDVIEHLPPPKSRELMKHLVYLMKRGGILIGQTPNFTSANIRLFREKDPVICPPSHSCYFTLSTLHNYFSYLGLKRNRLYSTGLSTNSFFRRQKFHKSFLETGRFLPVAVPVRSIFRIIGFAMQPFNLGYQIHFRYLKPWVRFSKSMMLLPHYFIQRPKRR